MTELIFEKQPSGYEAPLRLTDNQKVVVHLDTGSPITIISIPDLLALTKENLSVFRIRVERFIEKHGKLNYGVYGSQITKVEHSFIPYVVKDIIIGETKVFRFLFWVDVTFYNKAIIEPTSILFGYDYIFSGEKSFDKNDNFRIKIDSVVPDTKSIGYALSNLDDGIHEISMLLKP